MERDRETERQRDRERGKEREEGNREKRERREEEKERRREKRFDRSLNHLSCSAITTLNAPKRSPPNPSSFDSPSLTTFPFQIPLSKKTELL